LKTFRQPPACWIAAVCATELALVCCVILTFPIFAFIGTVSPDITHAVLATAAYFPAIANAVILLMLIKRFAAAQPNNWKDIILFGGSLLTGTALAFLASKVCELVTDRRLFTV
jgi:hypothetical protein